MKVGQKALVADSFEYSPCHERKLGRQRRRQKSRKVPNSPLWRDAEKTQIL